MSGVRWLSAQEQRHWRAYLEVTARLFDKVNRELQQTHNLSLADYEVLVRLSEAPDRRLRMTSLAEHTYSSKSRLSHAVARLERTGLVRRVNCPTDKRGWFAELTAEGLATLERAAPDHVETVRAHLLDVLTRAEFSAVGTAMIKLRDHLRSGSEESDLDCPAAS
ncbi:MAG: MarR family transcriptional regulator [Sporichthyaceae bacterium]|nr:MarR family transcriptional regulator [Sporichthyaceae bacterium]